MHEHIYSGKGTVGIRCDEDTMREAFNDTSSSENSQASPCEVARFSNTLSWSRRAQESGGGGGGGALASEISPLWFNTYQGKHYALSL